MSRFSTTTFSAAGYASFGGSCVALSCGKLLELGHHGGILDTNEQQLSARNGSCFLFACHGLKLIQPVLRMSRSVVGCAASRYIVHCIPYLLSSVTIHKAHEGGSVVDEMDPQRILAEDVCEGAEKPARPPRSAPGAVVSEAGSGEWKANPLFHFTQSLTRDAMNRN